MSRAKAFGERRREERGRERLGTRSILAKCKSAGDSFVSASIAARKDGMDKGCREANARIISCHKIRLANERLDRLPVCLGTRESHSRSFHHSDSLSLSLCG